MCIIALSSSACSLPAFYSPRPLAVCGLAGFALNVCIYAILSAEGTLFDVAIGVSVTLLSSGAAFEADAFVD